MDKLIKLDLKDKKLINYLEENLRLSITQIAKKIGVSKEVANYRLKRLISSKIIKRFFILIDNFLIDMKLYRLSIDLHNLEKDTKKEIIDYVKGIKNVDINVFLQGSNDIEILLYIRKPNEFYNFYNNFLEKYSNYIKEKKLEVVVKQHFLGNKHINGKENKNILGDDNKTISIDEKDNEILNILIKNPRASVIDISSKSKISPSASIYRLKKLKNNKIIKGYGIVLNNHLLGYEVFRVKVSLKNLLLKDKLISHLISNKNVIKINEFAGEIDLDFEIALSNANELHNLLEDLRRKFDFVKEFEAINIIED